VKKRGIFSIEKNDGAFNTFFKKHFTFKKKTLIFSQFSQFFSSLKYKYTIMCNYLNKYTNLNDAHYIRYTSLWGHNSFAPLFGIKFKKKNLFTLVISMEAYIVHLAKGIRIFGQGYALKPL
jgi:hypothetical protein